MSTDVSSKVLTGHFLTYAQIFAILLVPRLLSASYNIIHDTDETYNYWEPLHFLLHASGFQTWEYSPAYAIRSWSYIALHALPLVPVKDVISREQQFYILRFILGTVSAATESLLVSTVADVLGSEVASLTMFGLAGSAGMFVASTAFLPSSFTMYTSTLGLAFALRKQYFWSTFSFAVGTVLGWPFSALLFIPIFCLSVFEAHIPIYSYIRAVLVSLQILLFDTLYEFSKYRIWTIVPLNIILYNVFASDRGPDLFGTEPFSYYLKNMLLNLNIMLPFALLAVPAAVYMRSKAYLTATLGSLLWLAVFSTQSHKEERFMYPIYPALILSASIGLRSVLTAIQPATNAIASVLSTRSEVLERTAKLFFVLASSILSAIRISSLVTNYSAPLSLFPSLPSGQNYCIGSDWYRFPTSFLLPQNTTLSFVESSFKGLLPGKFEESWSIPAGMNDLNQWSPDKVVDSKKCDAMITWQEEYSETHRHYFLDRETGVKRSGYYGYEVQTVPQETNADRLNRLGIDLFGRKLDKEGKRYEDGDLGGAIKRDSPRFGSQD